MYVSHESIDIKFARSILQNPFELLVRRMVDHIIVGHHGCYPAKRAPTQQASPVIWVGAKFCR